MSEEELMRRHIAGVPDPDDRAWWIRHWEWKGSTYWRVLCLIDEAIQVMAWEATTPELGIDDQLVFETLAILNQSVRGPGGFEWEARALIRKQTYWLKREAIKRATDRGLVFLRLIAWRGSCRTCGGDGIYRDYDGFSRRYSARCRRCSGRGHVTLEFIECNVADRYAFHLPHDHTHPFRSDQIERLQRHPAGTWAPNAPGRRIGVEQARGLLNPLKRLFWANKPQYVKEIYTYMNEEIFPSRLIPPPPGGDFPGAKTP